VPEKREEITTEGGLQLGQKHQRDSIGKAVQKLRDAGIRTSLFIDPDADAIRAAAELEVAAVELHTGGYAEAWKQRHERTGSELVASQLQRVHTAAALSRSLGLAVHAGHGLTYENVAPIARIEEIEELNIGHSVVSRALLTGMERAVRELKDIIVQARR
jgi:pyridoxine 5-phosphate synthase